jgi:N-methylhydantoinase B
MRHLIKQYEGRIEPGDVFIGNDPYTASGQHLPDIYIIKPIFVDDQLSGWATTLAHHSDVGGIIAGSNSIGTQEIFQEGLRLPFLKLYEKSKLNDAIWKIVETNVRVPELVLGDIQAQKVACEVGAREYQRLFSHYGAETMQRYSDELQKYSEALARAEFAEIPDGVYEFTDHIDGLGENPEPIVLQVALTVRADEVVVDWTGSSPQVKGGINSPIPFSKAAVFTSLRSVMSSEVPNCHGYTKAITVKAPAGSIVNPVYPAACGARGITGLRMIDCMFGALAKAVPDRITADGYGGATLPTFAGYREDGAFVFTETLMGNWGGSASHDGQEGVPHVGGNQSNVPIELIEVDYPLRIEEYSLMIDSGGPGKYRGGLSVVREYRALEDNIMLSVRSDKRAYPPHGLFGGLEGHPSINIVNPGKDERVLPVLMMQPLTLRKGDVFRHVMPGGGGYGNPLERDPAAVLDDFIAEKVSEDQAVKSYGVIIRKDPENRPYVDLEATTQCRQNKCTEEGRK